MSVSRATSRAVGWPGRPFEDRTLASAAALPLLFWFSRLDCHPESARYRASA